MLFVAEAASFQPKGGGSESVGKRTVSRPSLQNLHICVGIGDDLCSQSEQIKH